MGKGVDDFSPTILPSAFAILGVTNSRRGRCVLLRQLMNSGTHASFYVPLLSSLKPKTLSKVIWDLARSFDGIAEQWNGAKEVTEQE